MRSVRDWKSDTMRWAEAHSIAHSPPPPTTTGANPLLGLAHAALRAHALKLSKGIPSQGAELESALRALQALHPQPEANEARATSSLIKLAHAGMQLHAATLAKGIEPEEGSPLVLVEAALRTALKGRAV
jgi:hypothetical protein